MTNPKFKVGDLVYCPTETTKIIELKDSGSIAYPFMFYCDGVKYAHLHICTADGRLCKDDPVPAIFHATEEKHAMLEQLHGVKFEKPTPKTKPTPQEVIKHLLTKQKYVMCYVGFVSLDQVRRFRDIAVIKQVQPYLDTSDFRWRYAIPVDNNGNEITSIDD